MSRPIVRRGLKEILVRELEGRPGGEAGNAQQVLSEVQNHDWDLLILDVTMPGRTALRFSGPQEAAAQTTRIGLEHASCRRVGQAVAKRWSFRLHE